MNTQPTLETERLILRPFTLDDASDVQAMAGDRKVADMTFNIPHPYLLEVAEQWIATHEAGYRAGDATFAITLRETGRLIGAVGLRKDEEPDVAELGYWIGVPFWGNGYCTEAAGAVVSFGFTSLGYTKLFATHLVGNPASGRVMQKIGMHRTGELTRFAEKFDREVELIRYEMSSGC
ncbi:MAG: GNAT family N-acetyltransferase [Phycisphaerae bacterium]